MYYVKSTLLFFVTINIYRLKQTLSSFMNGKNNANTMMFTHYFYIEIFILLIYVTVFMYVVPISYRL